MADHQGRLEPVTGPAVPLERVVRNVYEVTWNPEPGRLKRTWVSIDEYGEEAAFRKACAIRREKEREMYGEVVAPNWEGSLSKLLAS